MPETNTSIPTFADYVQDRKYINNVSPKIVECTETCIGSLALWTFATSPRQLIPIQLDKGNKPANKDVLPTFTATQVQALLAFKPPALLSDEPRPLVVA